MHMGAIDTTKRIQYRNNPVTGVLEYRYVWEDSNLGSWLSSVWKKVTKPIKKILHTIEKKIIRPIIKPVAIVAATWAGSLIGVPQAGAVLSAALKAKDSKKAAQAASQVAANAGAPIEIPAREDVMDKTRYDALLVQLNNANNAGRSNDVVAIAKNLNAMARISAPRWDGGRATYSQVQSPPSSIKQPFIPGATLPIPYTDPGYRVAQQPSMFPGFNLGAMGNITPMLMLGGGALLLIMMMQRR